MKTNFKRLTAFLVDILVICLVLMVIYYFLPTNDTITISNNITEVSEKLLNNEIGKMDFYKIVATNMYELDKTNILFNAFNTLIIMLYFVLVPVITKGYTLGLYINNLKLEGKVNILHLLVRNLVATGLLYLILSTTLVCFTKDVLYFSLISILGIIQFLLVIISTFMIIYRRDLKGIQDMISGIEVKEVKS